MIDTRSLPQTIAGMLANLMLLGATLASARSSIYSSMTHIGEPSTTTTNRGKPLTTTITSTTSGKPSVYSSMTRIDEPVTITTATDDDELSTATAAAACKVVEWNKVLQLQMDTVGDICCPLYAVMSAVSCPLYAVCCLLSRVCCRFCCLLSADYRGMHAR
jgi:hypothetical protein